MLKQNRKALSLQLLTKHQERIKSMVTKIKEYKPVFNQNKQYKTYQRQRIQKRMEQRQIQSDKLFDQNMKIIYKIQTTGAKVQTRKFPKVSPNLQRMKTLSIRSHSTSATKQKFKTKDVFRNQEQLFNENMKIIINIECTEPKVACWIPKKVRQLNELNILKKRQEQKKIINKFKEISKEIHKISRMGSFRGNSSSKSFRSPSQSSLV